MVPARAGSFTILQNADKLCDAVHISKPVGAIAATAAAESLQGMPAVIVKRFVRKIAEGVRSHYSIRRRSDGLFQLYHDDPYRGVNQPYSSEDQAISGLFADLEVAEAELLRMRSDLEPMG